MTLINKLSKLSGVSATVLQSKTYKEAVIKLTVSYTLTVGVILAIFSLIVYSSFYVLVEKRPFDIEQPKLSFDSIKDEPVKNAGHEASEHLLAIIIYADIASFFVVLLASYLLAKKTLAPLELSYLQQKQFVSDTAHELRTPLAIIKAGDELLLQKDRTVDAYKNGLQINLEEVNRLITLTNELLFLAKPLPLVTSRSGEVDLAKITERKVSLTQPYAKSKHINIKSVVVSEIKINGRTEEIEQVILNLLKNAIDYNKSGGEVVVKVGKNDKSAFLEITDTGVGISEDEQKLIFNRFYKVDKARSANDSFGSGLGLSIVKEIVTSHKGLIKMVSKTDTGTTIRIDFPLFS